MAGVSQATVEPPRGGRLQGAPERENPRVFQLI